MLALGIVGAAVFGVRATGGLGRFVFCLKKERSHFQNVKTKNFLILSLGDNRLNKPKRPGKESFGPLQLSHVGLGWLSCTSVLLCLCAALLYCG